MSDTSDTEFERRVASREDIMDLTRELSLELGDAVPWGEYPTTVTVTIEVDDAE